MGGGAEGRKSSVGLTGSPPSQVPITLYTCMCLSLLPGSSMFRSIMHTRENCMIYGGPGFLAVISSGYSPNPHPSAASKLALFRSLPVCRRLSLQKGEECGEGVRGGKEPNHTTTRKYGPLKIIQYSRKHIFKNAVVNITRQLNE